MQIHKDDIIDAKALPPEEPEASMAEIGLTFLVLAGTLLMILSFVAFIVAIGTLRVHSHHVAGFTFAGQIALLGLFLGVCSGFAFLFGVYNLKKINEKKAKVRR